MSDKFETLSEVDIGKIAQLVEVLEKSSFDHLTLELEEFRLTIGTGAAAPTEATMPSAPPVTPRVQAPSPGQGDAAAKSTVSEPAFAPAAPAEEGLVDIVATTMGRFYSRPDPNSDPFVSVGSKVEPDSTVGLVEVMKLFNGITAGVSGVVAEICVEDAQLVEYGQVLLRVRPEG